MAFNIQISKDTELDICFAKAMNELETFYGFKWKGKKPKIFIFPDRNTASSLFERKVPDWSSGWVRDKDICLLDYSVIKKENKGYPKDKYTDGVKHELAHSFYLVMSKNTVGPKWLWEGVAVYLEKINKKETDVSKLKNYRFHTFLKFYNKHKIGDVSVYHESAYIVDILIKKFGRKKLLILIKKIKYIKNTKKAFDQCFKLIYGFKPNYKDFNRILLELTK